MTDRTALPVSPTSAGRLLVAIASILLRSLVSVLAPVAILLETTRRVVQTAVAEFRGNVDARRVDDDRVPVPTARGLVGPEWAHRRGLAGDPVPGEIDSFDVYDREGFDATRVHPEVRRFYERTREYDLTYETTWHRGFRFGARLAARLTTRLEQLNLPGRSDAGPKRLESRLVAVPSREVSDGPIPDSLSDARVWTRTDPETGEAVFVAVYATLERDDATYASVAVPLPGAALATVLRPDALETGIGSDPDEGSDERTAGGTGVRFTTRGPGAGGLYLATRLGALRLPMAQSFRVWPADATGAPRGPVEDPDLVASHDVWLLGRRFLTIRYGIDRAGSASR